MPNRQLSRASSAVEVEGAFIAASTARRNAQRLGFGARACFAVGDWASALTGQFDVIVANPPYIESAEIARLPREVRDFDPRLALDGGADGLGAYRAIMADASRVLRAGGLFVCEIGAGQDAAVAGIVSGRGFVIEDIVPDLAGIARCVVARRP